MKNILFPVITLWCFSISSCGKTPNQSDAPDDQGPVAAKVPDIKWQRALGGSDREVLGSIRQTSDGGYIIGGGTFSGDGDVPPPRENVGWVIKINENAEVQWQKKLRKYNLEPASVVSIEPTADGGYIAGLSKGSTYPSAWYVKLDASGSILWDKTFEKTWDPSIQQAKDGTYLAISKYDDFDRYFGDVLELYKLDRDGNLIWAKAPGGLWDGPVSALLTSDGGIMLAGLCVNWDGPLTPAPGYLLVKLDQKGDMQWKKSLGIKDARPRSSVSIIQTQEGGYAAIGTIKPLSDDQQNSWDYLLVKLDQSGNIQWQKTYGGNRSEQPTAICQTKDNGYVVAGYSLSNDGDLTSNRGEEDFWVVKTAADGKLQWQKSLGGSQSDKAVSILQTTDGGFIVGGNTYSKDGDVTGSHTSGSDWWDIWIVKLGY